MRQINEKRMPDSASTDHDITGRLLPGGKAKRLAGWVGADRFLISVVYEMDMRVAAQLGNSTI